MSPANHQVSLCVLHLKPWSFIKSTITSILCLQPSVKYTFTDTSPLFLQFMPRPWVDDLEGWTQIAPSSATDGLTTCTTRMVAQQLVLTGLLLLFIFLMMNFNGLRPLETTGGIATSHSFIVTAALASAATWLETMNSPGCGTRRRFYSEGGE